MLRVSQEKDRATIYLHLSGNISAEDDFQKLLGDLRMGPQDILVVECRDVQFIDAVGIRNWVVYFKSLKKRGINFAFEHLAVCLVEHLNLAKDFLCGGKLISVRVPYFCANCNHVFSAVHEVASLKQDLAKVSKRVECESCRKHQAELDSEADDYFEFLRNL